MHFSRAVLALVLFVSLCRGQYPVAPPFGPSAHPKAVSAAKIAKIQNLAAEMHNRWLVLDQTCDPRAVFAVAYLYMTHSAANLVSNGYFDDGNKMADFISNFAQRYITAYDNYAAGNMAGVSRPWAIYFNALTSNRSDVTQDVTLGMNAHINYDLGIVAYERGYARPNLTADYYRVNDLMAQVDLDITASLGRYDPQFYNTDFVSQTYFTASVQMVTSWRTTAYAEAVAYQTAADTTGAVTGVVTGIVTGLLGGTNGVTGATVASLQLASEAAAVAAAIPFAVPYPYSTAASRVAYCMTQNTLPLPNY